MFRDLKNGFSKLHSVPLYFSYDTHRNSGKRRFCWRGSVIVSWNRPWPGWTNSKRNKGSWKKRRRRRGRRKRHLVPAEAAIDGRITVWSIRFLKLEGFLFYGSGDNPISLYVWLGWLPRFPVAKAVKGMTNDLKGCVKPVLWSKRLRAQNVWKLIEAVVW